MRIDPIRYEQIRNTADNAFAAARSASDLAREARDRRDLERARLAEHRQARPWDKAGLAGIEQSLGPIEREAARLQAAMDHANRVAENAGAVWTAVRDHARREGFRP